MSEVESVFIDESVEEVKLKMTLYEIKKLIFDLIETKNKEILKLEKFARELLDEIDDYKKENKNLKLKLKRKKRK